MKNVCSTDVVLESELNKVEISGVLQALVICINLALEECFIQNTHAWVFEVMIDTTFLLPQAKRFVVPEIKNADYLRLARTLT